MSSLYLILLIVLFLIGLPVAFALGGTSVLLTMMERGLNFNPGFFAQRSMAGLDNFLLLSVPFFIFAGKIMNVGGITTRIFRFAKSLVPGFLRGGLGHVTVSSSMIFAGMTGTAVSDAAGLGAVVLKQMKKEGYDEDFSVAITAAASTIGPIIPPSVPMVIYGLMTGVSIGGILIAGVIPGILVGLSLMVAVEIYAIKNGLSKGSRLNPREILSSFREAFLSLLTPVIIIGGMLLGIFTPTEAAAVGALYAIILSKVIYKEVSFKEIWQLMKETAIDTGTIMLIVSMAMIYGYLITRSGITVAMVDAISHISTNPVVVSLILIAFLLFVGTFLEATAAITILAPVFLPLLANAHIDPINFGVIMVLTMMIGLLTPPVGMVLFVLNRISGIPLYRIIKAVIPYIIPLLIVDLLLAFFPQITLVLPQIFFGK